MRSGHSLRACQLCRRRRVKCDKTLPTCTRCANFGQPCPGYPAFRTFIDQRSKARERVIRHGGRTSTFQGTESSLETPPITIDESPLTASSHEFTAASSSADHHTFQDTVSNAGDTLQNIETETWAPIDGDLQYFDLDIESYYADGNNACGFFADLADIEAQNSHANEQDATTLASGIHVHQNAASAQDDPQIEEPEEFEMVEFDSETSTLLRLYVEMLGPWMDLFDTEAYFTHVVPRNSAFDALLRLALTAVAAKQTARYLTSPSPSQYSKVFNLVLAEHPSDTTDKWFYRAASYYDQGISFLRSRLQRLIEKYGNLESNNVTGDMSSHAILSTASRNFSGSAAVQQKAKTYEQNVLSAVSMFSFYETLDECVGGPSQHLTGFLALAESLDSGTPSPRTEARLLFASKSAGRAAFWYFVRKDILTSYSHARKPAFDPERRLLWVAAGLPGEVFSIQRDRRPSDVLRDVLNPGVAGDVNTMTYIIIWLSLRVVTMIDAWDKPTSSRSETRTLASLSGTFRQARPEEMNTIRASEWTMAREQLDWWFKFRPQLFHAYACHRIGTTAGEGRKINKTAFFSCSAGAAVMQLYHFVEILLLINQPPVASYGSNQASKLRALKQNNQEIESHSMEICAIALEMPAFAVHRLMSCPLRLASVYLDSPQDQSMILRALANVLMETCSPAENVV